MSHSKVIGPAAAAAALPVTGNSSLTLVLIGFALVAGGLLFLRAGRIRRHGA